MLTKRPLFSVVVPTYGRGDLLVSAVESVLRQTVDDLEVLVVDDAGPQPPEVPNDPRVRFIRRPVNGGAAAARNTGMRLARGRWITFCDDDDVYVPSRLEIVLSSLERAPVVVCKMARMDDADGAPLNGRELEGDVSGSILTGPVPHVGTCTIAREAAIPFNDAFSVSEDVEWWIRLALRARVVSVPVVGYLFREHGGARLTGRVGARLAARLQLLELHQKYFRDRPAAAAYQWRRAGGFALVAGDKLVARTAFLNAFRRGRNLRDIVHLTRAVL